MSTHELFVPLAIAQGAYFVLTGVWPILNMKTFEAITGEKTDKWLVQTLGGLITVVGLVLLVAAWRGSPNAEVVVLGMGSAVALGTADVTFVLRRIISPIYLLDAVAEALLVVAWIIVAWSL